MPNTEKNATEAEDSVKGGAVRCHHIAYYIRASLLISLRSFRTRPCGKCTTLSNNVVVMPHV